MTYTLLPKAEKEILHALLPAEARRLERVEYVAGLIHSRKLAKVRGYRSRQIGIIVLKDDGVSSTDVVFSEPAGEFPSEALIAKLMLVAP